jgi:electron transfer flavoprotein alpha subunit
VGIVMTRPLHTEIWVWGDLRNERLFRSGLNVMAKAHELARSLSGRAVAVLMSSSSHKEKCSSPEASAPVSVHTAIEDYLAHGADMVYVLDNQELITPRADIYSAALAHTVRERSPRLVLFPLTDFGRELAARTARINNIGLIAECLGLRIEQGRVVATCPSWGGEIMADITFSEGLRTGFATVSPHAFKAVEVCGEPGTTEWIAIDRLEVPKRLTLLSSAFEPEEKQGLEDSPVVVVGGAGLGNAEGFGLVRGLATALGGQVGATRPPVLQHWVEEERLIGQTGKTIRPNLLFSVATSGAIQYTAGIMEATTIVAINRDQDAPIFRVSDIGVVADARAFLPLLTAKVRQAVMRRLADELSEEKGAKKGDGFGARVRRLRETHEWSIESLAQATGQSPEFIENVEKDELTPPVSFLLRLATAFKVDPGRFLRKEEKAMIRDLRAQELIKRTQNYSYQTLSPGAENDHLRAFMITIESRQAHKPVAYKHEGEEFIFVMEGELGLTVGTKTHLLRSGESIHFNSAIAHTLKSISNQPTRCLVVLHTP